MEAQRFSEARQRTELVVSKRPDLAEAQALLGELLIDNDPAALGAWHQKLPVSANLNANIWYVRGLWAQQLGEEKAAARCFWEAIRRSPTHRRANYQLGLACRNIDPTAAAAFSERADQLQEYSELLEKVLNSAARSRLRFAV